MRVRAWIIVMQYPDEPLAGRPDGGVNLPGFRHGETSVTPPLLVHFALLVHTNSKSLYFISQPHTLPPGAAVVSYEPMHDCNLVPSLKASKQNVQ